MKREYRSIPSRRKQKGWTQAQLARQADVSLRTIQFAESGRGTLKPQTLQQIADALGCEFDELAVDEAVTRDDAFQQIPWNVSGMLRRRFQVPPQATCTRPEQVRNLLLRMRHDWKKHLRKTSAQPPSEVYRRGDEILDQDLDRYIERYVDLWRCLPETIQVATDGQEQFGVSVVLPLTHAAFDAFVHGELKWLDIRGDDLCENSQHLLLDSVCEFADTPRGSWHQITSNLSFTMISQIARFSKDPLGSDFQMASFAASELNSIRLNEGGFRCNGARLPSVGFPIHVFSSVGTNVFTERYVQCSNVSHIARLTRESWIAGLNRRRKQTILTWTIRLMKWVQAFDLPERADSEGAAEVLIA
ncbi:MAG: helix-turn-helix transcriptional regulator [Planctomycetota bacterium]